MRDQNLHHLSNWIPTFYCFIEQLRFTFLRRWSMSKNFSSPTELLNWSNRSAGLHTSEVIAEFNETMIIRSSWEPINRVPLRSYYEMPKLRLIFLSQASLPIAQNRIQTDPDLADKARWYVTPIIDQEWWNPDNLIHCLQSCPPWPNSDRWRLPG